MSVQESKPWRWYLEYLFTQGYDGLKEFVHGNVNWGPATDAQRPLQQKR